MKSTYILFSFLLSLQSFAQVGIGTISPDPSTILDINSTTKGVLLPKLTNTERDAIALPQNGLLIFNTTSNTFECNTGTTSSPTWKPITLGTNHYIGSFIISSTGSTSITGLPFEPSSVKFSAYANIESSNIDADNGVGNNNNNIPNSFGNMTGFARNDGMSIAEQVIYCGGSGSSINDISRYASNTHSIGVRYSNNNGDNIGTTTATVTSFNSDGFTINVDNHSDNLLVIFEANY